jgi:hypothetical protein
MVADPEPEKPMTETPVEGPHPHEFHIQIDRVHYAVTKEEMTGAELRHLPHPPIDETRDVYEVRPGQTDRLIGDTDVVEIRDGLRFFTAPRHINPGRKADW